MTARRLAVAAYLALAAGLAWHYAVAKPNRYGDGHEYIQMTEGLARTGSPALTPDVAADVLAYAAATGVDYVHPPEISFVRAGNGRLYAWHFWAYPLSAVPARWAVGLAAADPLKALQLANVGWYLLAVGAAAFASTGPPVRRATFLVLTALSPAVWYLPFTGAEVFTWALVTIALVLLDRRQYAAAAFAAGLAATQNPPVGLLVAVIVLLSLGERSWRATMFAAAGGAVCLAAPAFYQWHFGVPNLIAVHPEHSTGRVTLARTWGLLAGPNHGLLTFAPGAVLLAVGGVWAAARRRPAATAGLLLAAAGMVVACQRAVNWNCAGMGLHRYVLWVLPILVWVAATGLEAAPALGRRLLPAVAAGHAAILVLAAPDRLDYLRPTALARYVWRKAPWLDTPDPHVFLVRTTGTEGPVEPARLPVGFATGGGRVTKLLVSPESLPLVAVRYWVTDDYRQVLERAGAEKTGPFYLHPPKDAVRCWPGSPARRWE